MVGYGGSSAGSYLADPTSPIPSYCAAIILFQKYPVHQLSWLALKNTVHIDTHHPQPSNKGNTSICIEGAESIWEQSKVELIFFG